MANSYCEVWLEPASTIATLRQFVNTTGIITRVVISLDLSFASYLIKTQMFQLKFSGNSEEAHTKYGLAAWAYSHCAGF
jgi:hypothetical protein